MVAGAENTRLSLVPIAGHLVALRGLLREVWEDPMVSLTAFSGHVVPGPGMGMLDHSVFTDLWWFYQALH